MEAETEVEGTVEEAAEEAMAVEVTVQEAAEAEMEAEPSSLSPSQVDRSLAA